VAGDLREDSQFRVESQCFAAIPLARGQHEEHPRLARVQWDPDRNEIGAPDGIYYILGGATFPEYLEEEGLVGIALLCGFHLATRKLWLLSERRFMTIDAGTDGIDLYPQDAPRPLQHWLKGCLRYYLGSIFYYQESVPVMQKYFPGLRRAFPKNPRPAFVSYLWSDFDAAMNTVAEWYSYDRLRFYEGSRLDREFLAYDADKTVKYPALAALCVAVNGLDRSINNDYYIRRILKEAAADEHAVRDERSREKPVRSLFDV
jgi:hypothetical protein